MDFRSLAVEYADRNIFNHETRDAMVRIADLFGRRASCPTLSDFSLDAVIRFKTETMRVAKAVTYNGYLKYLRIVADFGVEEGLLEKNHFRSVKLAPTEYPLPKTISDNDLWTLLSHLVENKHLYEPVWFWVSVIKTLYYTGMRRRQLVTLKRRDLDFSSRTLYLRAEGSKTRREWAIPMHSAIIDDLQLVVESAEKILGHKLSASDAVFNICIHNKQYERCSVTPGQMKATSITDFFKRVNRRTGLKVSPHKFRHTLATRVCNPSQGEPDIFAAQILLGHTSIKTTRGYVTTSHMRLERMMESLEMPDLATKALLRS